MSVCVCVCVFTSTTYGLNNAKFVSKYLAFLRDTQTSCTIKCPHRF